LLLLLLSRLFVLRVVLLAILLAVLTILLRLLLLLLLLPIPVRLLVLAVALLGAILLVSIVLLAVSVLLVLLARCEIVCARLKALGPRRESVAVLLHVHPLRVVGELISLLLPVFGHRGGMCSAGCGVVMLGLSLVWRI